MGHFAVGLVMQVLRPFKMSDFVQAGGVTGTVHEIGLTPPCRSHRQGGQRRRPARRIHRWRPAIAAILNVNAMTTPAPDIEILQFTPEGPLLAVRPCCHTDHCRRPFFGTRPSALATFDAAGYPVPETPLPPRNR